MRVLRTAEYKSMPWKNGGGVTTEIAVSPAGAGLDDFDWRISMARVESGGPFSRFPGIDRTLAVLEGEGIVLGIDGRRPTSVTEATAPLSFPADAPTEAALIDGPITDLNVMTRRGRMVHSVERLVISAPMEIATRPGSTLIFCRDGEAVFSGAGPIRLGPLETLQLGPDAAILRVEPARETTLFVIRITAPADTFAPTVTTCFQT